MGIIFLSWINSAIIYTNDIHTMKWYQSKGYDCMAIIQNLRHRIASNTKKKQSKSNKKKRTHEWAVNDWSVWTFVGCYQNQCKGSAHKNWIAGNQKPVYGEAKTHQTTTTNILIVNVDSIEKRTQTVASDAVVAALACKCVENLNCLSHARITSSFIISSRDNNVNFNNHNNDTTNENIMGKYIINERISSKK